MLLRAGMAPDDLKKVTEEIATTCAARESRVTVSRRFKPLVTIDVIRRDLLAPGKVVPSRLADTAVLAVVPEWLALPGDPESVPELDSEPVPAASGWPHTPLEGDDW